ncbi:MAG: MmgE/PrpD family protein [Rhodospirillum sp.]|nr:MmgE/PrpD family protein [Rhodospirillum sp.]MCF8490550.1 MmgE/PrpD family protein [Rhodospirillum sp.]MCF8500596.1 MmgE/PrpD family protein [Rhodospirillum sp.]
MTKTIPANMATAALLDMAESLNWNIIPPEARKAARRHFLDTCASMIAGMSGGVTQATGRVLLKAATPGPLDMPGCPLRLSPEGFALMGGTAAHGVELDDGHRGGSVHLGVAVVPALLATAPLAEKSGEDILSALVVGYETICALSTAANPAFRNQGFHPTSAAGPLGAALSVGVALGLNRDALSNALGIAASQAGGLFAFLGGGGDVKRLHGGFAARGGLMAALFAREGIDAPGGIIERPSGFAQAFAGAAPGEGLPLPALPPDGEFQILDCYIKPYACCRHLQPAMEALIRLREAHGLTPENVASIAVETYGIAAKHARTGWADMVGAQLSFPYCLAVALRFGRADLVHYGDDIRGGDWVQPVADRIEIHASAEMDALYPRQRPARVVVSTTEGERFEYFAPEALGCRDMPLSDEALIDKATQLMIPVLGEDRADVLTRRLWDIDQAPSLEGLFKDMGP